MRAIDLFSGCGGLSEGFRQAGFTIIGGADLDEPSLRTYARNFPEAQALDLDLAATSPGALAERLSIRPGQLDALIGGPPCQGFSKNVPARDRWRSDPKNLLMERFLAYVRYFRPGSVLIENVAEARNAFARSYSELIVEEFARLGYETSESTFIATEYGVPQNRRRAFFVAVARGARFLAPAPTHAAESDLLHASFVTVWDAISDLDALVAGEGSSPSPYPASASSSYQRLMRNGSRRVHDHVARPLAPRQLARLRSLREGEGAKDLPAHLAPRSHYSGAYGRLRRDAPAPTITRWVFHPGSGRFSHPYRDRVITIREAARLQGFPDHFVFDGTYIQKSHQVGNAVPPLLAGVIATALRACL